MNDRAVFLAALELADAERAAYLDEACAGDDALRQHVERLLRAHAPDDSFLEKPAAAREGTVDHEPLPERAGTAIGPYKLLQQIGEGGMGVVWMAEQQEPIRRMVALKIIKEELDSERVGARFEAERQALALMDHPNIARVFDAGATESGRPYFVMELVKGVPITRFCDERKLTPRERLELFVPVCQAVQHAHQKGVIHRDLKPSNILIALYDGKPVPKVIDFGIAKATGQRLTEKTLFTAFGTVVGTVEYMSPEQAELNQLDIDTRSDVYSLGVLLYELLTGTTPLDRALLAKAGLLEMLRQVREEDPPRPSARLSSSETLPAISARCGTEPAKLTRLVRGELDWIALKALEKDRTRRYETANALAKDVERYLKDEPVEACPPTLGYRLRKVFRKHKAGLTAAVGFAAMLLVTVVLTTWQAIRAMDARADAIAERDDKEQARQDEAEQKRIAEKESDEKEKALKTARDVNENLRSSQYLWDMQMLPIAWEAGNVGHTTQLLARYTPTPELRALRTFEWYYWDRQCHAERDSRKLETSGVSELSFSGDGRWVAISRLPLPGSPRDPEPKSPRDPEVSVCELATGKELGSHRMPLKETPPPEMKDLRTNLRTKRKLQLSDNGRRVAVARFFHDNRADTRSWQHVKVVEIGTGKVLFDHQDWAVNVLEWTLSPDGNRLAIVLISGETPQRKTSLKVWDLNRGKELFTVEGPSGRVKPSRPNWDIESIEISNFSADSKWVCGTVPGEKQGTRLAKVWDAKTGKELQSWNLKPESAGRLVYSPDGVWVAGMLNDGSGLQKTATLKVWAVATGKEYRSFTIPLRERVRNVGPAPVASDYLPFFDASSRRLAVWWNWDTEVPVWDLDMGKHLCTISRGAASQQQPQFSHDGQRLIDINGTLITGWNTDTGKVAFSLRGHLKSVRACAFSKDDRRLFSVEYGGTLKEWEIQPKEPMVIPIEGSFKLLARQSLRDFAFSRDATRVARLVGVSDGENVSQAVAVCDAVTGQKPKFLKPGPREGGYGTAVAISGDGRRIVLARGSIGDSQPAKGRVEASAKLPPIDLTVWDASTLKEASHCVLPELRVAGPLAFAPDLSRAAVVDGRAQEDGKIDLKMFDVVTGRKLCTFDMPEQSVTHMTFSQDGRRLAGFVGRGTGRSSLSGGMGSSRMSEVTSKLTVWDAATGLKLVSVKAPSASARMIAWSPDGNRLAIGLMGKELLKVYDATTGEEPFELVDATGGSSRSQVYALTFSPDGRRIAGYVCSTGVRRDKSLKIWDAATGKELFTVEVGPNGPDILPDAPGLSFTADGHRLVVCAPRWTAFASENIVLWTVDATPRPEAKKP